MQFEVDLFHVTVNWPMPATHTYCFSNATDFSHPWPLLTAAYASVIKNTLRHSTEHTRDNI